MAKRYGYTLRALQAMHPAACATDMRLVWRDGERGNAGIVDTRTHPGCEPWTNLPSFSGPREMRLLGLQLIASANEWERANEPDPVEVVLP